MTIVNNEVFVNTPVSADESPVALKALTADGVPFKTAALTIDQLDRGYRWAGEDGLLKAILTVNEGIRIGAGAWFTVSEDGSCRACAVVNAAISLGLFSLNEVEVGSTITEPDFWDKLTNRVADHFGLPRRFLCRFIERFDSLGLDYRIDGGHPYRPDWAAITSKALAQARNPFKSYFKSV